MPKFFSTGKGKGRKVHPITPHVNYRKAERQNLSLSLINLNTSEGKNLANIYMLKFNEAKSREDKVRLKRHVVQVANLARTMSRNPKFTSEEREKLAAIADSHEQVKNQMFIPPSNVEVHPANNITVANRIKANLEKSGYKVGTPQKMNDGTYMVLAKKLSVKKQKQIVAELKDNKKDECRDSEKYRKQGDTLKSIGDTDGAKILYQIGREEAKHADLQSAIIERHT